jgi:hypothetical protein
MEKLILLFDEFILKAITLTESLLEHDYRDGQKLESFTANRERLLTIIDQISRQIDWSTVSVEQRDEFSRRIDYIKTLDVKLLTKLQEYQEEVKREIEQTFKQKENIKGYNLSDVK